MVDSIVTFVLEHLSSLHADEVKLLSGVEDEITSLSAKLVFMDTFLKNSEGKRNDDIVKQVVSQIRDVAHEAEDVVDTYLVNANKHKSRNILAKCFHLKDHMIMLHEVDDRIKKIKVRVDDIYKNKTTYGIEEGDFRSRGHITIEANVESLRRRRSNVEEEEVVGLVHDSTFVIEKLNETDSSLNVVCIIGMGGLGKTTLARKIYNNDEVKNMFSCHAWGYVSNDYRARELLLSLFQCLKSSTHEYKDLSVEHLKEKVKECLKGNKYLVVLDDIWKTEVWDELKGAFPDEKNGSRILITTRMREVAFYSRAFITYDLPFLNKEDSWQLFSKKVFGEKECPCDLESLGRTMVESCKGLPLAIIVLAGMVAKKDRLEREWLRIKNNLNWHLALEDYTIVMDILRLSYDDLPPRLKPCFLYLGIYPEDYEIQIRNLIRLWIAEGFIQPEKIGTSNAPKLEDVADYYLDELVDRSLVQVASRRSDGGVKTCRIHDLLRDLCILESKANKFMEVCTELDIDKCNPRRLSLNYKTQFSPTKYNQSHARSLFLFGVMLHWNSKSNSWKWIRKSFKLARVLDLSQVSLESPASGLKTLIHLRYLRIKTHDRIIMNNILASICNLWNLETLHIRCNDDVTLPSGMWKMKRLRHVYLKPGFLLPPAHMSREEKRKKMLNLQTLCRVALDSQIISMLKNDSFPNLTNLSIRYNEYYQGSQFWDSEALKFLSRLHTLKIIGLQDIQVYVLQLNLTKITMRGFRGSRFMTILGKLANLQVLKLRDGTIPGPLDCTVGQFPQLQVFHMREVVIEGCWVQKKDAMPRLQRLILRRCQYLGELPEQLRSLAIVQ